MVNEIYTTRIYNVSKSRYISFFTAINHTISMKTKWRRKSKRKRKSSTVTSCTSYHWRDILRPVIRALLILSAIYTLRFPLRRKSGALSPLSRTKRLLTGTWKHTHTYYTRTHTHAHAHTHTHTHTHTHPLTHTHTHTHTHTTHNTYAAPARKSFSGVHVAVATIKPDGACDIGETPRKSDPRVPASRPCRSGYFERARDAHDVGSANKSKHLDKRPKDVSLPTRM